jgi:hypothetical protein
VTVNETRQTAPVRTCIVPAHRQGVRSVSRFVALAAAGCSGDTGPEKYNPDKYDDDAKVLSIVMGSEQLQLWCDRLRRLPQLLRRQPAWGCCDR